MPLGTKNRQKQTAAICKLHLHLKYKDRPALVEEFIQEIEGTGKDQNITHWGLLTDESHDNEEMLKRLDEAFEKWLNP